MAGRKQNGFERRGRGGSLNLANAQPKHNSNPASITDVRRLLESVAIELWPLAQLQSNPGNARTHNDRQITQLAASIRTFGFLSPILIDERGMVLAGHGRLAAARLVGLEVVPVVQVKHLTPARKRALVLADNRLAELAGWDRKLLRIELAELSALDLDFEIEVTGFDTVEIDRLQQIGIDETRPDPADEIPALDDSSAVVTQLGDIWQLGRHRVICGNALEPEAFARLLQRERAQMVFTDPPYNVPIIGHVTGNGRRRHREFAMASGEMSVTEFTAFLGDAFEMMSRHSTNGSIHFVCMDWRHQYELLRASRPVYGPPKNLCVWVKSNAGMGSFYRSRHELIYAFKVGTAAHINNFGLGERGRYRTNIWEYPGVNSFGINRDDELAMHPTVKPAALVADAIRDCSRRGGLILDPFGGSGTTLIAAERTGRISRLIELDRRYADIIVRRWEKFAGESARLADTNQTFAEMAHERAKQLEGKSDCALTSRRRRPSSTSQLNSKES